VGVALVLFLVSRRAGGYHHAIDTHATNRAIASQITSPIANHSTARSGGQFARGPPRTMIKMTNGPPKDTSVIATKSM
jgi:hypothetical protein